MKILVTSHVFHPDHSGSALYASDLAFYLAEQGHEVTAISNFPFYPEWRKRPEDSGRLFRTEQHRGVRVLRAWAFIPRKVNGWRRMLHDLSFLAFVTLNYLRVGKQDIVIAVAPPILLGVPMIVFSRLWRAVSVFHIQDLQIEAAVNLGIVRQGPAIKILGRIERWIYRHATRIATITQGMRETLIAKQVPTDKLGLYYNWIDTRAQAERPTPGHFRAGLAESVRGRFLIAYAGNLGIKQNVGRLVDLAERFADRTDLHFLIAGEGADKPRLLAYAQQKRLANLDFLPFLNPEQYRELLADIDVAFIPQQRGVGNIFFPSKLLGIMLQGVPLLIAAESDSELSRFVTDNDCGLAADPDDLDALDSHLRRLADDAPLRQSLAQQQREVVRCFDREAILSRFTADMTALANNTTPV